MPVEELKDKDSISKKMVTTILSNTIVLGCDYLTTSMPFGMAIKSEALVRKASWHDVLQPKEWRDAYKRTWSVLKYGFYPTFLLGVAGVEAIKQAGSPTLIQYSDFIIPTIINAGTAPACSLTSINTRFKTQIDLFQLYRQQGLSGVTRLTGGAGSIGLKEGLCFYALHHDTTSLANKMADTSACYQSISFLFRHHDGNPTVLTKLLASTPDGLAMLAAQPFTIFAANSAICKYRLLQEPQLLPPKPKFSSPLALINWQMSFNKLVCRSIIEEGKKTGLSPLRSFAPGVFIRTSSLLGTLTVFKYCLDPVTKLISDHVTHQLPKLNL